MKTMIGVLLLLLGAGRVCGQEPPRTAPFQVGGYGDDARAVTCVAGPAGATFQQVVWAWVPDDLGLAYITLRFFFPHNLSLRRHPVFNDLVSAWIVTDYPADTVEWNMVFRACPSGWIRVFAQEFVLLDDQPARIRIQAGDSMMRDCAFVLNAVEVMNELSINDPDCAPAAAAGASWSGLKSMYR